MAPLYLILAGVVLAMGLLIWQLVRSAGGPGSSLAGSSTLTADQVGRVTLAEAKQALDQGEAVFVDVRGASDFQASHIPGALNIPLNEIENRLDELDPNRWIITYCT